LVREVGKHLNLSRGRTDVGPDIKQILGGLASVAGGIGALRTHAGDAYGRGKGTARVDARIARLAVHAAGTTSLFFFETWQGQSTTKKPGADASALGGGCSVRGVSG
jgi:Abortive infection C-terminus